MLAFPLNTESTGRFETTARNYHSTLRKIRRFQLCGLLNVVFRVLSAVACILHNQCSLFADSVNCRIVLSWLTEILSSSGLSLELSPNVNFYASCRRDLRVGGAAILSNRLQIICSGRQPILPPQYQQQPTDPPSYSLLIAYSITRGIKPPGT